MWLYEFILSGSVMKHLDCLSVTSVRPDVAVSLCLSLSACTDAYTRWLNLYQTVNFIIIGAVNFMLSSSVC